MPAGPPFRALRLDHIVLRTADLGRALGFYRDILGFPVERILPDLGLTQLRAGDSLIDLVSLDSELGRKGGAGPGAEGRNQDHFCLRIDPFEPKALIGYLSGKGVEAALSGVAARYGADGTGPSLYIQDPDGNTVELKGPPTEGPLNQS